MRACFRTRDSRALAFGRATSCPPEMIESAIELRAPVRVKLIRLAVARVPRFVRSAFPNRRELRATLAMLLINYWWQSLTRDPPVHEFKRA